MTKSAKLVTVVPANPAKGLPALKEPEDFKPRVRKSKDEQLALTGLKDYLSKYNGLMCVKLPFVNLGARNLMLVRVLEAPAGCTDTLLVRNHEVTSPALAVKHAALALQLATARKEIIKYLAGLGLHPRSNGETLSFGGPKTYPKIEIQVSEPGDDEAIEIYLDYQMSDDSGHQDMEWFVTDLSSFQKEFSELAVHMLGQYEHAGFHAAIAMFKSAVISKPAAKKRKK